MRCNRTQISVTSLRGKQTREWWFGTGCINNINESKDIKNTEEEKTVSYYCPLSPAKGDLNLHQMLKWIICFNLNQSRHNYCHIFVQLCVLN